MLKNFIQKNLKGKLQEALLKILYVFTLVVQIKKREKIEIKGEKTGKEAKPEASLIFLGRVQSVASSILLITSFQLKLFFVKDRYASLTNKTFFAHSNSKRRKKKYT